MRSILWFARVYMRVVSLEPTAILEFGKQIWVERASSWVDLSLALRSMAAE